MSKLNLVFFQVPDPEKTAGIFEGVRGLKPDGIRAFWARALDWLIATQKRRAKSALGNYYDDHPPDINS
jgi:hypothetical protein